MDPRNLDCVVLNFVDRSALTSVVSWLSDWCRWNFVDLGLRPSSPGLWVLTWFFIRASQLNKARLRTLNEGVTKDPQVDCGRSFSCVNLNRSSSL